VEGGLHGGVEEGLSVQKTRDLLQPALKPAWRKEIFDVEQP
jgi:hypothetical protein